MHIKLLTGLCGAAALSCSIGTPACAESAWDATDTQSSAMKWELRYLALSAVDAGETINCLNRNICEEGNPLFGKHPSAKMLIASKLGIGLVHFALFSAVNARSPKTALRIAQVSCAMQGGVVLLNARFSFH